MNKETSSDAQDLYWYCSVGIVLTRSYYARASGTARRHRANFSSTRNMLSSTACRDASLSFLHQFSEHTLRSAHNEEPPAPVPRVSSTHQSTCAASCRVAASHAGTQEHNTAMPKPFLHKYTHTQNPLPLNQGRWAIAATTRPVVLPQ